jgi:hypothetical protein
LAFHPYPQVIPTLCNVSGFGPPRACSARFSLPMGGSPGFGSTPRDSWGCPRRPFGLAFAPAPPVSRLSLATRRHSSAHSTKGTPSPGQAWLRPAVGARFQDLFHSPRRGAFHRSLTVLVRYRSPRVFSLGRWSAPLPAGFRVSGGTHAGTPPRSRRRRLRDSHPLRWPVPAAFG